MKSTALVFWLAVLGILGFAYGSWHLWQAYQSDDYGSSLMAAQAPAPYKTGLMQTPGGELDDFTLVDSAGETYHLHDSAGKVRALSFFFVSCPAICFQLNNTLAQLQKGMSSDDIQFISITCDPKNDTPTTLTSYAARFGADPKRWVFLTGEMSTLEQIGRALLITVAPSTHSDRVVLIDKQGRIRGNFRATEADQLAKLKEAIAKLTAEPYTPPAETAAAPADKSASADAAAGQQPAPATAESGK